MDGPLGKGRLDQWNLESAFKLQAEAEKKVQPSHPTNLHCNVAFLEHEGWIQASIRDKPVFTSYFPVVVTKHLLGKACDVAGV